MRVLLTYPSLRRPGGVQTFTRQLAAKLRALGHEVMGHGLLRDSGDLPAWDPDLPELADAGSGGFEPDIIHAQHHLQAMAALLAFPRAPAVFHCHGGTWRDQVVLHPRIGRYLAMSHSLADRIQIENALAPDRVDILLNAVDTEVFKPLHPLPEQASRLLVYHGRLPPGHPAVQAIIAAAAALGLQLDFAGRLFGRLVEDPEQTLPRYPIVFASGISALEAMACGCAVIILGRSSCGPMVDSSNFDSLRRHNFSIADNSPPPEVNPIIRAIQAYDPADASRVCARVRAEATIGVSVHRLVDIYRQVIDWHRGNPPDPQAESRAVAVFLRRITPLVHAANHFVPALAKEVRP